MVTMSEKSDNFSKAIIIIFAVIFLFIFFTMIESIIGTESAPEQNKTSDCPPRIELDEAINLYKNGNIIKKIEPELNSVYLSSQALKTLSQDDLQTLGFLCACYSSEVKGTGLIWVDIYENQTHKKIAKFSKSNGFKMY